MDFPDTVGLGSESKHSRQPIPPPMASANLVYQLKMNPACPAVLDKVGSLARSLTEIQSFPNMRTRQVLFDLERASNR